MTTTSRRTFLKLASAASVAAVAFRDAIPLAANPLGLPLGLQLYSLRELLPKDFDGTLKAVAAAGYQDVEAAGLRIIHCRCCNRSWTPFSITRSSWGCST